MYLYWHKVQTAIAGLCPRNIKMGHIFCHPRGLNWSIIYFCGTKNNRNPNSHKEIYSEWYEVEAGLDFFIAQNVDLCRVPLTSLVEWSMDLVG